LLVIVYPECFAIQGIARYLDAFLANLPLDHPPVLLITGDEHPVTHRYAGVDIWRRPFSRNRLTQLIWGLRVRRKLLHLWRQDRDLRVNLHIPPLLPGLLLPRAVVTVVTVHTTCVGLTGRFYAWRYYRSDWSTPARVVRTLMESLILRRATRAVALTEQGREELALSGYGGTVKVVPNGVDPQSFSPAPAESKDWDVLFIGRFERRKGSRALVPMCKRLIAARAAVRIGIVGGGGREYLRARQALARDCENIHFIGDVPLADAPRYYARSRVYVSTSFYEGLPGTCLEAMAMGMPVVAWNLDFYRGLVSDGVTGYLVPANDLELMCSRVIELLDDPAMAASMGSNGRTAVLSGYDWRVISRRLLAALE